MKLSVALVRGVRGAVGFAVLLGFLSLGRWINEQGHVPLPGTVTGMALIAACLVLIESGSETRARAAAKIVTPPARWLISHLGLLFIPAGVGIMTQAALLRREWLPIVAALLGSTWVGVAVTGWVMQRLAPAAAPSSPP